MLLIAVLTWEAETGGFMCVQKQPGLQNEFSDIQGYTRNSVSKSKAIVIVITIIIIVSK